MVVSKTSMKSVMRCYVAARDSQWTKWLWLYRGGRFDDKMRTINRLWKDAGGERWTWPDWRNGML